MNVETPTEALDGLRQRLYEIAERGEITVDAMAVRAPDRPLTIGVIGIFSTGKSTFLNALTKRLLLPTSLSPKNAIPMYITRTTGNELAELVDDRKGNATITSVEAAVEKGALPDGADVDDLERFVSDLKLREIKLKIHLPDLFDGVQLIDTPGLDSPYEEHELFAIRVLRECDIVFYLLDEILKDADRSALIIGQKHCSRFIFLQTKVDNVKPESSWEVTIESNETEIEKLIGQPVTVYPISAKRTLRSENMDESPEWGMPRVRELLAEAIGDRRRLRSMTDAKRLLTAAQDAVQHSEVRTTSLAEGETAQQGKIRELAERLRLARAIGTRLDPLLAEATRTISEFCGTHIDGWREELRAAMLPVRRGDGVVERVRGAALKRTRAILDRDAEDEVKRAVILADGRALKVLYETFGIDLAGPLRGHPEIDVVPPTPRRDWLTKICNWFGGEESIKESEIRNVAEETASSLKAALLAAAKSSLEEAFSKYRSYVEAAIPTVDTERSAVENQLTASRAEREARVAHSAGVTVALRNLCDDIAKLVEAFAARPASLTVPPN